MTIPAAKVKALCTESEAALVRASRKGELELLSHAEVKQLAVRARKLVGKWRDLKRGQSRTRGREAGFGEADANTKLKKQLFLEALTSFEARLEKLEAKGAHTAAKPAPKTTKKHRTVEHRATRAAVRKGMVAAQDLVNSELMSEPAPAAPAPVAAKAPAAKPAVATKKPAKAAAPAARPAKTAVPKGRQKSVAAIDPTKQRKAITAAKTSRVARSGKTTRVLSHVKSRGKRVQARRDAKN